MKKVIMISLFGNLNKPNNRLRNLLKHLDCEEVTFITSDFSHEYKCYKNASRIKDYNISEVRLHVKEYEHNISIKRIISHLGFARELKLFLNGIDSMPDFVYCSMPTSSATYVAGNWCKKNKIPFLIDIIDIWPDSLIPITPARNLIKFIFVPWQMLTRKCYRLADYISAESRAYKELAEKYNINARSSYTYLGIDQVLVKKLISKSSISINKPKDEIWLCYGGSLDYSYDFDTILKATAYLHKKGIKYKLWMIGDGEQKEYLSQEISRLGINGMITGRLEYSDFLKYLHMCDIAFNPFNPQSRVAHSYKFNDYLSTGCFVMNSLRGETAEMIEEYNIGLNYTCESVNEDLYNVCLHWEELSLELNRRISCAIDIYLDCNSIYKNLAEDIKRNIRCVVKS